ncbi:MAG: beta-ketoacyl synthase chain length factor [Burkholderiales bacterium]|nr:beta-ketoacyl synthase chain length factor [Burkholderiales bacterium]
MSRGALTLGIDAIGLLAPGLPDWATAQSVLGGHQPWQNTPPLIPAPQRLPAAERRRVGNATRLALAAVEQMFAHAAPVDPATVATVFASSSGDGDNCHALCEALAQPEPLVSPTRFTNSVHNAPAGYWSIAAGVRAPSNSLCAFDGSFSAGLLEAGVQAIASGQPVALISSEVPYPEPIHATRPLAAPFGLALLLTPPAAPTRLARIELHALAEQAHDRLDDEGLEALRSSVPAARCLPLLAAIAAGRWGTVRLEALDGQSLPVKVLPCA